MKKTVVFFVVLTAIAMGSIFAQENMKMEKLELTSSWDKVFPQSDKVTYSKVTFCNRYGITLAADLYIPKNATEKLPAIAVAGPFIGNTDPEDLRNSAALRTQISRNLTNVQASLDGLMVDRPRRNLIRPNSNPR